MSIIKSALGLVTGGASGGIGIGVYVAIGAVVVGTIASTIFYVQSLRADVRTAVEVQARLEGTIESNEKTMKSLRDSVAQGQKIATELSSGWRAISADRAGLEKALTRLDVKNPTELQRIANENHDQSLRCNEIVTGADIVPEDANNVVCPDLVKRRSK